MITRAGEIYRCQNEHCRAEIKVTKGSLEGDSNPRCCCGAEMKKPYSTPVLRRLEPTAELTELFGRITSRGSLATTVADSTSEQEA